jgi:raffinose/stachyose/melibiose transport system substrate-binding protein
MNRTWRLLTLLTMISLIAAACTAPATPVPPTQPAPTAVPPTAAPAPTAVPPTAAPTAVPPTAVPPTAVPTAVPEKIKLVVWWWGEQEAPGAQKFMDETVAKYKALHPNIDFETVLQSTDTLVPAFQSAAQAKQGPDIQYFWGGVWTLENAWNGSIIPLDNLISKDEWGNYINNFERSYNGQIWGVPWYLSGNPMVFNPDLFTKAGLDPKNPPATWDELKAACGKLKAIGVVPIAGGLKDGWFGGWLFSILARQTQDSEKAFMQASVGQGAKFTDPSFTEWWSRLAELKTAGCWNADINSLDYQQGQDMFVQGKAAMIFGNDTFLAGWAQTMTWDKIGVMMVPKYGKGKLADTYVVTAQGWGVTSWSKHPQQAADFLVFMHTPERLAAWFNYTGVLPADKRLDTSLIKQPQLQQIYKWDTTVSGPNLENFIPSQMDNDANFAGTQLLFSGDKKPSELGQFTEDVLIKWRDQNPDEVKNFTAWMK